LKDIVPDFIKLEAIPAMVARLDRIKDSAPVFDELKKQMMRFGFIERILGDADKEAKLVAYFEAIRASGVGVDNPQFWLQYAIACMSFGDYINADSHFETAFGLARSRGGYDPYQIENHHARFLLESRMKSSSWDDYYDSFSAANDIIQRQVSNYKEGFYPYRVARLYLDYLEANYKKLTSDQLGRVSQWCDKIMQASEAAPDAVRRSVYWRQARDAMKHAKDFIAEVI